MVDKILGLTTTVNYVNCIYNKKKVPRQHSEYSRLHVGLYIQTWGPSSEPSRVPAIVQPHQKHGLKPGFGGFHFCRFRHADGQRDARFINIPHTFLYQISTANSADSALTARNYTAAVKCSVHGLYQGHAFDDGRTGETARFTFYSSPSGNLH